MEKYHGISPLNTPEYSGFPTLPKHLKWMDAENDSVSESPNLLFQEVKAWKTKIWCKIGPSWIAYHETAYTKLSLQKRLLFLFSEGKKKEFFPPFPTKLQKSTMKSQVFFVGFLDNANGTSFHTPQNLKIRPFFSKHLCDESAHQLGKRTGAECIVTFIKIHGSFNDTSGLFSVGWKIYQPWICWNWFSWR